MRKRTKRIQACVIVVSAVALAGYYAAESHMSTSHTTTEHIAFEDTQPNSDQEQHITKNAVAAKPLLTHLSTTQPDWHIPHDQVEEELKQEKPRAEQAPLKPIKEPDYVPPIAENRTTQPHYTGDLNDYDAYNEFQTNREKALKQAFAKAAHNKVNTLNEWLVRGKQANLSEEQIKFAEEKIATLQRLAKQMEEEATQIN